LPAAKKARKPPALGAVLEARKKNISSARTSERRGKQGESMTISKRNAIQIGVTVVRDKIVLTGDFEQDIQPGATIVWRCADHAVAVKFAGGVPFIQVPGNDPHSASVFVPADAPIYSLFKYTIVVFLEAQTITSDPIIVIVPPEGRQAR
jgi:hypothetical protein